MIGRLDAPTRFWLAGFAGLALFTGLVAGVKPALAIGFAGGIAFVAIAFTNLALALALFCAEPLRLDWDESGVIRIGAIVLVLGLLGAMSIRDRRQDFLSEHPLISLVLGMLIGWSMLSALWAENPGATLTPDGGIALGAVLILITYAAVRTRDQVVMVCTLLLIGAAASAVYAILSGPPPAGAAGRLSNRYLDPNELASTLVAGAALSVGLAQFAKRSPGLRLTAYVFGGLCIFGVLLTVSRGGLIALGIALLMAIAVAGRWRGRVAALAIVVAISGVYYYAALAPQESRDRILESTQGGAIQQEGRASLWQIGWRMVEANPVQGVGAGNFVTSSRHYVLRPGAVYRSEDIIDLSQPAHNTFLQMLAELGVVGFSLFAVIVCFSLASVIKAAGEFARRGDKAAEILSRAMAVGLTGLLAASFFISQPFYKEMWLLFGLCAALRAISLREPEESAEPPRGPGAYPPSRRLAASSS